MEPQKLAAHWKRTLEFAMRDHEQNTRKNSAGTEPKMFDDELIDALYQKLLFEESTSEFLSLVISEFAAGAGQLVHRTMELPHQARQARATMRRKEDKALSLESMNIDMDAAEPFFRGMYKADPAAQKGLEIPMNRPYLPIQSMDRETYLESPLYRYVLEPSGLSDLMSLRFPYGDGALALMIYKSGGRQFSESEIKAAGLLHPHLKRAFMIHDKLLVEDSVVERAARAYGYTAREHDIVVHLANGLPYRDIEAALGVTQNTLKWHLKNLFQKTGVKSLPEFLVRVFNS
jgi:DNA-binding CsgD family transcriptional regulator